MALTQLEVLAERVGRVVALDDSVRSLTFSDVRNVALDLATQLHRLGIRRGDIVGLSVKDEINNFLTTISLLILGTSQVVLASHDPTPLKLQLKQKLGVSRVVDDRVISGLLRKTSRIRSRTNPNYWEAEMGNLILKTSGSVNQAKLVPTPFSSLVLQADQHAFYRDSRFLRLASIEHNNSRRHRLYCFFNGGTNLFRRSEVDALDVNYVNSAGCTRFDIARSHFASLLEMSDSRILPPEISITVAGSPLAGFLRQKFQENVTPNLYVRYGSTESGTISIAGPDDHGTEGGVGFPLPGVEIGIAEINNGGGVGAVKIKAPGMATHYLGHDGPTHNVFDDGWFIPGDLGEISHSGMSRLLGRNTDAFTLDGVNIFPRDSEASMLKNHAIKDVAVVKRESTTHDGIPVAFVVLNPGFEFDELELLAWARNEMGLACPRQIIAVTELPTSDQGKIDYKELSERVNGG